MATKTSSKTATRKQAARGTAAARKPAAAAKTKLPKQKLKEDVAPGAKPRTPPPSKSAPETARPPGHEAESVSLIDRKKPSKKAEQGEPKPKRDVLPPISRIRASLETPAKPAPPTTPAPVESVTVDAPSIADAKTAPEATEPPPAEEETAAQKIILIKPPIIVKQLATELGLKPHQLIAELMNYNIFANVNQTVEPDIASKIAESHGFVLEKERREKGGGVHKVEQVVVAPHDGLMPQTIEAINHAKAAPRVKIMVAINKIDLPSANIDRVKKQLQERGLSPEDWGGETIVCPVSATKGTGIDHLLEMIALQAEVMELEASPTATPRGTVIEAQVDAGRGPTATVIVQMGTLRIGDAFICGDYSGKVKSLLDDRGKPIKEAAPSMPVKVLGFTGLPNAGDELLVMESERSAKTLSEERLLAKRTDKLTVPKRATLESLLDAAGGKKALRIVLKCDAQGSLEALVGALGQIESKKVDLEIIHSAVGPISESDILLASASNAVVVGFNVKVESMAVSAAKSEGVQVKLYSIIYELLDQMKEAMAGLLEPEHRETVIGHAEVKQVFNLSKGIVAGCLVTDGRIARVARARVLRKRQPVYDGGLSTLRRFQDDVKEVRSGLECGIKLGDFSEYQVGDVIECYQLEAFAQKL